jgi:myo-inositol-1(or 4)-monophosphatase
MARPVSTLAETYRAALDTGLELAAWASARILVRPESVETKQHLADHVTETDTDVERHVRRTLAERFPEHAIVGEEYGGEPGVAGRPTWYLDPVDGTTNYAHGLPWSSFSLALSDADGPVLGVVADPYRREIFSASRYSAAERDGTPIRCRNTATLSGEIVTTEWAGYRPWPGMAELLDRLAARLCSARIMGSTALSLVSVAAGRAAGCVIGGFDAIDGLAASFIAERAGAVALAADGTRTTFPAAGGILVAAPGVADDLWRDWQGHDVERHDRQGHDSRGG